MTIKLRILLCVFLLVLAGYGLVWLNYRDSRAGVAAVREQQIAATFLSYLHKINGLTDAMERNAIDLATAGETFYALRERIDPGQLVPEMERHLVRTFTLHPAAIGGGWWYEPYVFDSAQEHFGPYAYRSGEQVTFTWDLSSEAYDYPNQSWYLHGLPKDWPRNQVPARQLVWTEPYYDEAGSKALMMTVDALMLSRERHVIGMATVDWATEGMRQFVSAIKVTPGSFSFLIDRQSGRFVSFVADQRLVMQPADQPWARQVLARANTSGELDHLTQVNWQGREHRVYFISTDIGLLLGLFIPEDEILAEVIPDLRKNLYWSSLLAAAAIALVALAVFLAFRPFPRVANDVRASVQHDRGKLAVTPVAYPAQDELTPIVAALNDVLQRVAEFNASLAEVHEERRSAPRADSDAPLERKLALRTEELAQKNEALLKSLEGLRDVRQPAGEHDGVTQLVAGVVHGVNAPVGVALTAASHLRDEFGQLLVKHRSGFLTHADLERFFDASDEASGIAMEHLQRMSELTGTLKQICVDQRSGQRRRFGLCAYLGDILRSLEPHLQRLPHRISLECADDIELDSYPGALSQVVTGLVLNALRHAFEPGTPGNIALRAQRVGDRVLLTVSDDGRGIASGDLPDLFEAENASSRPRGHGGLELHLVHALVTNTLHGRIRCDSRPGTGTSFVIDLPIVA